MNRKGILVVVSGFSGVGKGTLMKLLTERYSQYALSISATTRKPRPGEVDGREYFFKSREEFEGLIAADQLIEYASYCDNYYGTPREYVETQMAEGRDVILEIEIQGALKVREQYPDALLLFVMPPDAGTLEKRLRDRGSEDEEVIRRRLARAVEESEYAPEYEYMIINDDLEQSMENVHRLIESQHNKINRNMDFVKEIQSELKDIAKGE
ncbi:MAG: guanylate kinase [Lachnospiraceae bacterium]|nr:guanylate kinase [Lachnospiraceae bacterium]